MFQRLCFRFFRFSTSFHIYKFYLDGQLIGTDQNPNLIIPNLSPCKIFSFSFRLQTILLAINPAI